MLTSVRYGIAYPNPATRGDTADVPRDINSVVSAIERSIMFSQGTLAARPVSTGGSPGIQGRMYIATDQNPMQAFYDYGTGWFLVGADPNAAVVPVGSSIEWDYAASGIPAWALLQYGQAVSRTTYAALAALALAAGYPHGTGDGTTTFNIADKRGRVSAGKDDMGGTAASRITAAISGTAGTVLGAAVGSEGVTLTTGQMPSHNHTVTGAPALTGAPTLSGAPALTGAPTMGGAPQLTGAPAMTDPGHNHGGATGGASIQVWENANGTASPGINAGAGGLFTNHSHPIASGTTGITVNAGSLAVNAGSLSVTAGSLAVNAGSLTISLGSMGVGVGSLGTGNTGVGGVHVNMSPTIIVNKIVRAI